MKDYIHSNYLLILLLSALLPANVSAQVQVSGKLTDESKQPVEFANIVLQSADDFYGAVSDGQGEFSIRASTGNYALKISVIGYERFEKELSIREDTNLGEIALTPLAIEIGEVTVKARRTVRRSDRFVINLANDPAVFGKTGSDVLSMSPGVFVQERDGTISINGKSGTRVTVNGRLLHEQGADLIRYLQTLRAEDIQRIEILPTAGAGYDADITGGVISIMLRRLRDDGLDGSAGVSYSFAPGAPEESVFSLRPSYSMNYRNNRLGMYAMLNYNEDHIFEHAVEETDFTTVDRSIRSNSDMPLARRTEQVRIGGTYDLDARQSVGLELYVSGDLQKNRSRTGLMETTETKRTDITSVYEGRNMTANRAASANYILQIDSLGSLFKALLDYHRNGTDNGQDYRAEYRGYMSLDSVYRSNVLTQNSLYAANADLELRFSEHTTLGAGLKYSRSEMDNSILFEYLKGTVWHENVPYSSENAFS
jgi:hypothetical protein